MDKYERVETSKTDESIGKNEIRVTTQGKMRRYISYATNLLQPSDPETKPVDYITLKAMGKAINKTVAIAEIIKRRIPNLHQVTDIDSTDIKEKYQPTQPGLEVVETTRHVSSILISLYPQAPENFETTIGYQPPIPPTEVKDMKSLPIKPRNRQQKRNNNKGPRNTDSQGEVSQTSAPQTTEQQQQEQPQQQRGLGQRGRGRRGGRRGRGGRGRGRRPQGDGEYQGNTSYQGQGNSGYQGQGNTSYQGNAYQGQGNTGYRGGYGRRGRGGRGRGGYGYGGRSQGGRQQRQPQEQ
jgi:DNA-binding protein